MKIGIITYDKPHKKSQDIIHKLINSEYKIEKLIITKFFKYNKIFNPIFAHRPSQFNNIEIDETLKKHNIKKVSIDEKNPFKKCDIVLIGGSNIIKSKYIEKDLILNSHSGLIPKVRGLDSFKWAIHNNYQVGNTLHFIDHNADLGKIIHQQKTPVYKNDTFFTFASRHYDSEINLLVNFERFISKKKYIKFNLSKKDPTKRMPSNIEKNLISKFEKYLAKFSKSEKKVKLTINDNTNLSLSWSNIRNIKYGKNCKVVNPVNLFECTLGDNVFVGPFTEIQKNVMIGNNSKISSHSFICELVKIGNKCFIGHGVMFVNDKFKNGKLGGNISNWDKTNIGNNVLIGSNATILPVNICNDVIIGSGSVVTKNINKPGVYAGNPVKFLKSL
jgi:acetyltransferase-like isoleucine patch superfamily enzyme/folate-dependent phosphoribosylglycinamide formyltransferase PurN